MYALLFDGLCLLLIFYLMRRQVVINDWLSEQQKAIRELTMTTDDQKQANHDLNAALDLVRSRVQFLESEQLADVTQLNELRIDQNVRTDRLATDLVDTRQKLATLDKNLRALAEARGEEVGA